MKKGIEMDQMMVKFRHIHFVGIGGIGMSGIARVMLDLGFSVSGSDLRATRLTRLLEERGAVIFEGHQGANVQGTDLVVVSSAIRPDNPEILEARQRGIPIYQRAQMLGYLMRSRFGIAVAGTHGKTTTTSMIARLLEHNDMNATVVVGGELNDIGSNAKLGTDRYLVAEADESDASFLHLEPSLAVVTNIDADVNLGADAFREFNYDYDQTQARVVELFVEFLTRLPANGLAVLCLDNERVRSILPQVKRRTVTYALDQAADLTAREIRMEEFHSTSVVYYREKRLGHLHLQVPGRHNIQNALAAIAVGMELNMKFQDIRQALEAFCGVQRRFQVYGEFQGILVVDDYAHNPDKVKAALHSARTGGRRRVVAVFQPHRYSRTRFLYEDFLRAFEQADQLVVSEIYSAGEDPLVGVKAEKLAEDIRVRGGHPDVVHLKTIPEIVAHLTRTLRAGDLVITLGAGDINQVAQELTEILSARSNPSAAAV